MAGAKVAAIINVTPLIDVLLVLLITFMILPTVLADFPQKRRSVPPTISLRRQIRNT